MWLRSPARPIFVFANRAPTRCTCRGRGPRGRTGKQGAMGTATTLTFKRKQLNIDKKAARDKAKAERVQRAYEHSHEKWYVYRRRALQTLIDEGSPVHRENDEGYFGSARLVSKKFVLLCSGVSFQEIELLGFLEGRLQHMLSEIRPESRLQEFLPLKSVRGPARKPDLQL